MNGIWEWFNTPVKGNVIQHIFLIVICVLVGMLLNSIIRTIKFCIENDYSYFPPLYQPEDKDNKINEQFNIVNDIDDCK